MRGGPLREESLDRLNRSVTKGTYGIFVVEAGTIPLMEGTPRALRACLVFGAARRAPQPIQEFAHERCCRAHRIRLAAPGMFCSLCPVLQ
ncbi:MAG: hypothetical protein ACLTTU_10120 [Bilophila wadsworthia]